jgi:hypothetical protein
MLLLLLLLLLRLLLIQCLLFSLGSLNCLCHLNHLQPEFHRPLAAAAAAFSLLPAL